MHFPRAFGWGVGILSRHAFERKISGTF